MAAPQFVPDCPLDQIVENPWNPNEMNVVDFAGLKASIRENGFHQPILVRPMADGRYEIIDGEHRWKACVELRNQGERGDVIPVYVQECDDAHAKLATLSNNLLRGTHDRIAEAKLVQDIQQAGISIAEIELHLGWRPIELEASLSLLDVAPTPPIVATGNEDPPVEVTILLLKLQYATYIEALDKAYQIVPDKDTLALIQGQVDAYNEAMQYAIKVGKFGKRGDAFTLVCKGFLYLAEHFPHVLQTNLPEMMQ